MAFDLSLTCGARAAIQWREHRPAWDE